MTNKNNQNEIVKKAFKALLADEDKMKFLAYSTQMLPTIEKLMNEQKEELIKEFEEMSLKYFNKCPKYDRQCIQCIFWKDFDKIKIKNWKS